MGQVAVLTCMKLWEDGSSAEFKPLPQTSHFPAINIPTLGFSLNTAKFGSHFTHSPVSKRDIEYQNGIYSTRMEYTVPEMGSVGIWYHRTGFNLMRSSQK